MKRFKTEICTTLLFCLVFFNSHEACALKKYRIGNYSFLKNDSLSKYFDIGSFGIKYNNPGQYNNQVTFSQFYQDGYNKSKTGWNVRSLGFVLHSKFNRFNFSVDQGIMKDPTDNNVPAKFAYRFGLCMDQNYLDGDQMSFGCFGGIHKPFPVLSFRGSYSHTLSRIIRFSGEIYAMITEDEGSYLFMATSFTKSFSNHSLTAKPYCLTSENIKAGFIFSDQIFFKNDKNSMTLKFVSGYYPDGYTYIDYNRINDRRYRISCEGLFNISRYQISMVPLVGYEYFQESSESYQASWHVQVELRYTFKNKEYSAENRHSKY